MNFDKLPISRRGFLQGTAAGAAALACGRLLAASPEDDDPGLIDAHSHVWIDDVEKYPLAGKFKVTDLIPRTFPPDKLLEMVGKHGVKRVVLIQHQVYHGTDNSFMTDTLAAYPGRFSAVAYIDAANPNVIDEVDRLRKLGVRGFRICEGDGGVPLWSDSEGMMKMWRRGPEIGVAMCPQIGPEYLPEVDRCCEKFPDTVVVIDHFARIGTDGEFRESDLKNLTKLARHKNAYAKLSAFYGIGDKSPPYDEITPMIRRVYDAFGPERLMWASDCPYQLLFGKNNTYEASINYVRDEIDFFTDADKEWILRKTAERVFFS